MTSDFFGNQWTPTPKTWFPHRMSRRIVLERRTIRVAPNVWTAALARAEQRHEVLAEEIRLFIGRYAAGELTNPPGPS